MTLTEQLKKFSLSMKFFFREETIKGQSVKSRSIQYAQGRRGFNYGKPRSKNKKQKKD